MTRDEMQPLLNHADLQVRNLADQYGTLWDAATDLCTSIVAEDFDCEIGLTPTGDCYETLRKVLASQPNEKKP